MKKILLLLFFIPTFCHSQQQTSVRDYPLDSTTNLITYKDVQEATGSTQKELYKKSKTWATVFFPAELAAITNDDIDFDRIIVTDNFKSSYPITLGENKSFIKYELTYSVIIYLKNDKYKIEISNFKYKENFDRTNTPTPVEIAFKIMKKIRAEGKPDKINIANGIESVLDQCERRSAAIIKNFVKSMRVASKDGF